MTDPALTLPEYLAGSAKLAAIVLPLAYAAVRLRRRYLPFWTAAPARLAEATLTLALLLWTSQLLGTLALFKPLPLIAASLLIAAVTRLVVQPPPAETGVAPEGRTQVPPSAGGVAVGPTRGPSRPPQWEAPRRQDPQAKGVGPHPSWEDPQAKGVGPHPNWPTLIATAATAIVFATWAIPLAASYAHGIVGVDSMWYHLPQSARFVHTGSVIDLHFTDPYFLNWYYPAHTELLHAVGMLAFERDWLSPPVNHAFLALGLLAAWCIGRPWGLGPHALVAATIVFAAQTMLDFQPGEARNDAAGLALLLGAVALLVNAPRHSRAGLLAAGLAAGLAVGTKLTLLAPIAALTVGVVFLAGRGRRWREGGAFVVAVLAGGGFWYLRNLIHAGNPLPWIERLGPISMPAPEVALELRPRFSVAHYLGDFEVWRDWFLPGLGEAIGPLWPAIAILVVGAAIAAVASARREPLLALVGGVVLITLVAYVFTPLTASGPEGAPEGFIWNLRYVAPALGLGLVLLPLLPGLRRRPVRGLVLGGLFAILVVQAVALDVWELGHRSWAIGSALAVLAVLGGGWVVTRRGILTRLPRLVRLAGAAALVSTLVLCGYLQQERYLEGRYDDVLAPLHLDDAIAWADSVTDAEIGTAGRGGIFFQYGFYGAELSNRVQWIGKPGPRGAWLPLESCARWRSAVNEAAYDYVITTYDRRYPGLDPSSREREWIRSDPAAVELLSDGPVAVYRLKGRLDPAGCPT